MVSIQLLCVGKLKEKHFTAACEEYQKRLSAFCKLTVTELPEVRLPENPSQAQIDGALEKEGAAILAKLPKGSNWCPVRGGGSPLQPRPGPADGRLDGGRGLPPDLCHWGFLRPAPVGENQAHLRLSMSPMTFPHHLARIMLLEQIYRAYQISAGTKYHK